MALRLHPDAVANFDGKAELLLPMVAEKPASRGQAVPVRRDMYVSHTVDASDPVVTASARLFIRDSRGNAVASYFLHEGGWVGLRDEGYVGMQRLAEAMSNTNDLRDTVSGDCLQREILDWVKERHSGTHGEPMTETVLARAAAAIRRFEIWIPVATSLVEEPVPLGRVILKPISSDFFDQWRRLTLESMEETTPQDRAQAEAFLTRHQKRLQGLTVAVMEITAEPAKAKEVAFAETEKALALFRFLSPTNVEPTAISLCVVLGKERQEATEHFIFTDGLLRFRGEGFIQAPRPENLSVDALRSDEIQRLLQRFGQLLASESRTPFKTAVLDAFLLYTRNALTPDVAEKLTYILAALESIFLKNRSEPIQQNLGERIAFALTQDGSERRRIVATVRSIYDRRSGFLHHGESIDDVAGMRDFMHTAWMAMGTLLTKLDAFRTVEEFVNALDDVKFGSGPPAVPG